ncbi:MAG: hypothetical protein DBX44_02050, partial [Oscillospiraceae bacterium]
MNVELRLLEKADLPQYKSDMQEAFQLGALEGGGLEGGELVLPEKDIDRSLHTKGAIAYKAVEDGSIIGGAIIVLNPEKKQGHLDFLYVKHGIQSKGVGQWIWKQIEALHPQITVWETCTASSCSRASEHRAICSRPSFSTENTSTHLHGTTLASSISTT